MRDLDRVYAEAIAHEKSVIDYARDNPMFRPGMFVEIHSGAPSHLPVEERPTRAFGKVISTSWSYFYCQHIMTVMQLFDGLMMEGIMSCNCIRIIATRNFSSINGGVR